MICTNLVKARIVELGLKNAYIANEMELAESSWYLKLNGERGLTIKEMFILQKLLKIPDDKLKVYFLN